MTALVRTRDGNSYVAESVAYRGSTLEIVGWWRARYGPPHSPSYRYGNRRRYCWPASRVESVRWDREVATDWRVAA